MKYKVGDKIKIKSLKWYNKHFKDDNTFYIKIKNVRFTKHMKEYCGKTFEIENIGPYYYHIKDLTFVFNDEMIVDLKKERKKKLKKLNEI